MKNIGVHSWGDLVDNGVTQSQLRKLLRDNSLIRLRRGWYAEPWAAPSVVAAVTRGGVLSCLSALRMHGVWVPEHCVDLHVRANSRNRRSGASFCSQFGGPELEAGPIDDLPVALRHAVRCLDDEGLVVVCDSILNGGLMSSDTLRRCLAALPETKFRLLDKCDELAQSGTETMVRVRLRSRGIDVRTQVKIPGLGRVDLLVGDRLIIETDSEEFHTGRDRYTEDRRRDREAIRLDYLPLRFTYTDVVHRWEHAEEVVLELVRKRLHRRSRHKRRR